MITNRFQTQKCVNPTKQAPTKEQFFLYKKKLINKCDRQLM